MNKILKNVLVAVSAIIGLIAITVVVMKFLGFDIDLDICNTDCCKKPPVKKYPEKAVTRIKRNYTEIKLPN